MTSQGLKRPSEIDMPNSPAHTIVPNIEIQQTTSNNNNNNNINGSSDKRRRTDTEYHSNNHPHTQNFQHHLSNNSPFKDSSSIFTAQQDDLAYLIQEEIRKALDTNQHLTNGLNEQPLLTFRQTQMICEKLIRQRELRLRDEYERILERKLLTYNTTNIALNLQQQQQALQQVQQQQRALNVANIQPHHHHQLNHQNHHQLNISAVTSAAISNPLLNTANSVPNLISSPITNPALSMNNSQQTILNGPVLLASNLDEQLAVPENLFTLFGVFGDVIRVKILFNKKDNALIQMADINQAQMAQGHLDKQRVFGKVIRVARSKHNQVQMPRDTNQSDAGLTKDFTNSPLHRFKIPGSRNYANIYPPSNTLHISNIPLTIEESELQKAFKKECGFDLVTFKFFPKDRKMALIKFDSIEHATMALIKMHNYQIGENINLKVSFSKSIMQQ